MNNVILLYKLDTFSSGLGEEWYLYKVVEDNIVLAQKWQNKDKKHRKIEVVSVSKIEE